MTKYIFHTTEGKFTKYNDLLCTALVIGHGIYTVEFENGLKIYAWENELTPA